MKNCEYFQALASRLLDDDLTAEERDALREHIRSCPDCRRVYDAFRQLRQAIREDAAVQPPPALARGVMDRIAARSRPAPVPAPAPTHRLRSWKKLAAAACFVVLVAAGAVTGIFSRGGGSGAQTYSENAEQPRQPVAESAGRSAAAGADGGWTADTPAAAGSTGSGSGSENLPSENALSDGTDAAAPAPVPGEGAAETEEETGLDAPPETVEAAPETIPIPPSSDTPEDVPEDAPMSLSMDAQEDTPEDAPRDAPADTSADVWDGMEANQAPPAEEGIMTAMEAPDSASVALPCPVCDAHGQTVGTLQDEDALAALLTGESWQGEDPEPVYTLDLHGVGYVFAADGNGGLLWQRAGDEGFTLSPATLADFQALILP